MVSLLQPLSDKLVGYRMFYFSVPIDTALLEANGINVSALYQIPKNCVKQLLLRPTLQLFLHWASFTENVANKKIDWRSYLRNHKNTTSTKFFSFFLPNHKIPIFYSFYLFVTTSIIISPNIPALRIMQAHTKRIRFYQATTICHKNFIAIILITEFYRFVHKYTNKHTSERTMWRVETYA